MRLIDFHPAIILLIGLVQLRDINAESECVKKQVEYGVVCVCNSTYCDFIGSIEVPSKGSALHYWSDESGERFQKGTETFGEKRSVADDAIQVTVDRSQTYQKIFGFGGAMTDAAGINIAKLTESAQDLLLKSYFGPDGLEYVFIRVPMGGTDFSTHAYSYDDVEGDETLEHFNLTVEDYDYKIPYIKKAQQLSSQPIVLFSAPWSSPKWMKTNNEFNGKGVLKDEYHELWAKYYVKFLKAYADSGLDFWAVSTENEPPNGNVENFPFNALGWTAETQRDWLAKYLGPVIESSDVSDVKILIFDDQRNLVLDWADTVLSDETANKYTAGIAVHWYRDSSTDPAILGEVHEHWPDKFILYTEACHMGGVRLGDWERGEEYASDIIEVINQWSTGWVDWNLALDPQGGPNWVSNFVDSPIIVNETSGEFYKEPMFYVLGHFSKFVPQGSIRIALDVETLEGTAFLRPDDALTVVLLNKQSEEVTANLVDPDRGEIQVVIPAKSLHTFVWN